LKKDSHIKGVFVVRCDQCKIELEFEEPFSSDLDGQYLEMTIFYNEPDEYQEKDFCSWKCCFKYILSMDSCENFISLPDVFIQPGTDRRETSFEGLKDVLSELK